MSTALQKINQMGDAAAEPRPGQELPSPGSGAGDTSSLVDEAEDQRLAERAECAQVEAAARPGAVEAGRTGVEPVLPFEVTS